jgi:colanic acid/amylovoran biosynthesis glycosyltransferase
MMRRNSLLLVIPSVVMDDNGSLRVEADFLNDLQVYCKNFDEVIFACPALNAEQSEGYIQRSAPLDELPRVARYIRLPYTYREDTHLSHYSKTRKLLRDLIEGADHLLFAPHAPLDWPTVAAREAFKIGRKYDVEYAVDYNEFMRFKIHSMPWGIRKFRKSILARWMKREADRYFARSALAMLQGQELFDAYKHAAPNPQMMLNVQVRDGDHISRAQIKEKVAEIRSGAPLRIVYSGRMNDRKGAVDWMKAINSAGCAVSATWFGDGPDRTDMESLNERGQVSLPGEVPRANVLFAMRDAHMFLFCHKVPESPRCLIEALASGAPLVGYRSLYPESLVAQGGGGKFVPKGDWQALGSLISQLNDDRDRLAELVLAAARTGRGFEHDNAVQRRADLIRQYAGKAAEPQDL